MKKLTDKELNIMNLLWENGALTMRDIMEKMPEPKPHFNTISTFVHRLEAHSMIKHQEIATRFYQYETSMSKEEYLERLNKENVLEYKVRFPEGHEQYVTSLINAIYAAANKANDFRTTQFLDWFVKEQGEEEKNADDLIKKFDLFAGDPKGLYLLDAELKTRVYTAPSLVL